ncbi:MAG: hypothetical protein ACAI18_15190 [Gemmatimonadales bacterium]
MRGQMAVVLLLASLTACATTKASDQASALMATVAVPGGVPAGQAY